MSLRELIEPFEWRIEPPEDVLDVADPTNDPYFRALELLQTRVALQISKMKPRHVEVARKLHVGVDTGDIAKATRLNPDSVSRIKRRDDVQYLLQLFQKVALQREGPSIDQRRNMLYRIAARSEHRDPNTTIAALRELNKMDGAYVPVLPPAPPAVNITINQDQFPRTALDDHSDGSESPSPPVLIEAPRDAE